MELSKSLCLKGAHRGMRRDLVKERARGQQVGQALHCGAGSRGGAGSTGMLKHEEALRLPAGVHWAAPRRPQPECSLMPTRRRRLRMSRCELNSVCRKRIRKQSH